MTDLTYTKQGVFTSFMPHTEAGEEAWRTMANAGHPRIFTIQLEQVLYQLRSAGYKVSKANKTEPKWTMEDEELLNELME